MERDEQLKKLKANLDYDMISIGGGATGLGCAVDAASRGLTTLLLEKYDFAKASPKQWGQLFYKKCFSA